MSDTRCGHQWSTQSWPVGDHACLREAGHEPIVNGDPRPVDHVCECGARTHA